MVWKTCECRLFPDNFTIAPDEPEIPPELVDPQAVAQQEDHDRQHRERNARDEAALVNTIGDEERQVLGLDDEQDDLDFQRAIEIEIRGGRDGRQPRMPRRERRREYPEERRINEMAPNTQAQLGDINRALALQQLRAIRGHGMRADPRDCRHPDFERVSEGGLCGYCHYTMRLWLYQCTLCPLRICGSCSQHRVPTECRHQVLGRVYREDRCEVCGIVPDSGTGLFECDTCRFRYCGNCRERVIWNR
jgi:hypothetical protein